MTVSGFAALTPRMPFAGLVVAVVAIDFGGQCDMLQLKEATKISLADLNRALEHARSMDLLSSWYGNHVSVHPRLMGIDKAKAKVKV